MAQPRINLYGADWCTKTALIRNYLQSEWIDFDYHNVEKDEEAAERVKKLYDGKLKFPTVTYEDDFLKNPKIGELKDWLKSKSL